ncbi:hypothetical protein [Cryptosporangium sp. NPDC048952]|uniref:hypothetical protein n=1 Tax=Cryptosporangium sp. NPDC048952 TaxID=3363961 RepID=UPI0037142414
MTGLSRRIAVLTLVLGASLGVAGAPAAADSTPGKMIAPQQAQQAALGLMSAEKELGLMCGLSKTADRLRARTVPLAVAARTAQVALKAAKAKRGCSAAVQLGAAVASILTIAETGNSVYVEMDHSSKRGFPLKKCTETIRVGTSEALSVPYKVTYSC